MQPDQSPPLAVPSRPLRSAKKVKIYVGFIIAPFVVLITTAILQFIVRFLINSQAGIDGLTTASPVQIIVNILSIFTGMLGFILLIAAPVFVILLINEVQKPKQ